MTLFRKKATSGGVRASDLQPPDRLASEAQDAYGHQRFEDAFGLYVEAVDKLHTMYVMGQCTYRTPSTDDQPILSGLLSALGAAKAMNPQFDSHSGVQQSCSYLSQIANTARNIGEPSALYDETAQDLYREASS